MDHIIYKIKGADDWEDASMFNGMIALFEYKPVDLGQFLEVVPRHRYVRHPYGTKYNFSRDQYICLIAGMYKNKLYPFVDQDFVDGKDIMTPDVKGHELRCQNKESTVVQDLWLYGKILYKALLKPLSEPNQLICMMVVADDKKDSSSCVRLWKKLNPKWRQSIRDYWGDWRSESEFGEFIIDKLERY